MEMYSDRGVVKRPVKERLGATFSSPPVPPGCHHQDVLKRQCKDNIKCSNDFNGVENHEVRDNVPKNLMVSKSNVSSATEIQKKTVGNAQTPTNICPGISKGRSTMEVNSVKTPAVQSASVPMTRGKKHIVVEQSTIAAFLQKLGLSKYVITFQAEEVDMFALKHMNDYDLRSMGLPMGPRKKILHALAAEKAK